MLRLARVLPATRIPIVVTGVLLFAIGVDVVLPVMSMVAPALWFDVLHVDRAPDALHLALLWRAAAQWVAFAVVQIIALACWRRWPHWLLVVAGARTSDWLTDLTYLVVMPDPSPARWVLLLPPLLNVGMPLLLVAAWLELTARPRA